MLIQGRVAYLFVAKQLPRHLGMPIHERGGG
jgi:hypothetical protein